MEVIILDGHLKSALAATRSLGKKGVRVICASERTSAMSLHSNYCAQRFVYPSPSKDKDAFVDAIIELAKNIGEKPLVYSFSDETFLPLARQREKINEYVTFIASQDESIDIAFDKIKTLSLAKKLNIPYVESYMVGSIADVENVAKGLSYPAVVKQVSSCIWKDNDGVKGTAEYVFDKDELLKKVTAIHTNTGKWPLVQKFIQGGEFGVEMLCKDGEIVAVSSHKRIRSLNPSGGAAVVKETICGTDIAKTMEREAAKLLKELRWEGPAMIEFKQDERDGALKLMEINGRFWGSLPLAIFAGVDFPYLYYKLARGDLNIDETKKIVCKTNVRSRHLLGDLHNLLIVLFKESPVRNILYPKRVEAVKEFFTPHTGQRYDVLNQDDVTPFFMEIIDGIKKKYNSFQNKPQKK